MSRLHGFSTTKEQRGRLSYGHKLRIIDNQDGKCTHCGHQFRYRIYLAKCVDITTGEVTWYKWWNPKRLLPPNIKMLEGRRCYGLDDLQIHHTIPLSQGGPDHVDNLEALCHACHTKAHAYRG